MDTKTLEKANELATEIKNLKEKKSTVQHLISRTKAKEGSAPLGSLKVLYPDDSSKTIVFLGEDEIDCLIPLVQYWDKKIAEDEEKLAAL